MFFYVFCLPCHLKVCSQEHMKRSTLNIDEAKPARNWRHLSKREVQKLHPHEKSRYLAVSIILHLCIMGYMTIAIRSYFIDYLYQLSS